MKEPEYFRNRVYLGDNWHTILIRRSRFNKRKIKGIIEDYDKKSSATT